MADSIRKTGGRGELDALWARMQSIALLVGFSTFDKAGIANGTTAGRLKTAAAVSYRVAGAAYSKAATDDLWNLSAQTATAAGKYRALWLYLDAAGVASIVASSSDADTAALALAALPEVDVAKSIIGVFVAGPSTNFALALAAQGTIYDQIPAGATNGTPAGHIIPNPLSLIAF